MEYIAWKKDFERPVDVDCVERSLRNVAPEVRRGSYVSEGSGARGYPKGSEVVQFNYVDPTLIGHFSLVVATLRDGHTRYWHGWEKLGNGVADEDRARVILLLNRANQAVARDCTLSFEEAGPHEGNS